jgi:hypothetical protein
MRNFSKIKKGEKYNHRNTMRYFEDYNLSLTQRLGKIAILRQPLIHRPVPAAILPVAARKRPAKDPRSVE